MKTKILLLGILGGLIILIVVLIGANVFRSSCIRYGGIPPCPNGIPPRVSFTEIIVPGAAKAVEFYVSDGGSLPKTEQEFTMNIIVPDNPQYFSLASEQRQEAQRFCQMGLDGIGIFDGWRRPLRYIYVRDNKDNKGHFMIYSYGENGIDEKGKGDDISKTDYVYWSDKEGRFTIDHEAKAAGIPTEEYRKTHPWPKEDKKLDTPPPTTPK